ASNVGGSVPLVRHHHEHGRTGEALAPRFEVSDFRLLRRACYLEARAIHCDHLHQTSPGPDRRLEFHSAGNRRPVSAYPAGCAVSAGWSDYSVLGIRVGASSVSETSRTFSKAWPHGGPGHREGDGLVTADFRSAQNRLMLQRAGANLEVANPASMADPVISPALAPLAGNRSGFMRFEIPEVWMRFLLALLGLVLAFAAALFSTVTRESGHLWG